MPKFTYKAKRGPGDTVVRDIVADSRAEALARIEAEAMTPVWIRPWREPDRGRRRMLLKRIRSRDVTLFTFQLASLLRARVPILRALSTVSEQCENREMAVLIADLEAAIRDGAMLSDALVRYPRHFPPLYVNMIRSGEGGGLLPEMLTSLAASREDEEEHRRQVQAAMAYPLLVALVGGATVFVMLSFFLPRVMRLFEHYEDLPGVTRSLLAVSRFCADYWFWMLLLAVLAVAVVRRLAALQPGRLFLDTLALRVPFAGAFLRDIDLARFARTFGLLSQSSMSIDHILRLSAGAMRNTVLVADVDKVRHLAVEQGMALADGAREADAFPPFFVNMIAVGEESGRLDEVLAEIARYYERSISRRIRLTTSLIEPIMLLLVGGIVGFIVFAMLLPVFELGGGLR